MLRFRPLSFVLAAHLALALPLAGCQIPSTAHHTGGLRFKMRFSEAALPFNIHAIPVQTNRFVIEVAGEGLDTPVTQTITKQEGQTDAEARILALPVGEKVVMVSAYEDEKLLAKGQNNVMIEANTSQQVEIELKPAAAAGEGNVTLRVDGDVPLPLNLSLVLEGEGLDSSRKESLALSAGSNPTATLNTSLPDGQKTVRIRVSIDGVDTADLPTLTEAFEVNGEGEILLSVDQIMSQYGAVLANAGGDLDLAQLLALIRLWQTSGDLQAVLAQLPPQALARLRQNPVLARLLAGNLPADNAVAPPVTPTSAPQTPALPFAQPGDGQIGLGAPVVPTPLPTAVSLFADVRLAIQAPQTPVKTLRNKPEFKPAVIIPLNKNLSQHPVLSNRVWGILLRTARFDAGTLDYEVRVVDERDTAVSVTRGTLSQRVPFEGRNYQAGFIQFFSQDGLLQLKANTRYGLEIKLSEKGSHETARYILNVPASQVVDLVDGRRTNTAPVDNNMLPDAANEAVTAPPVPETVVDEPVATEPAVTDTVVNEAPENEGGETLVEDVTGALGL